MEPFLNRIVTGDEKWVTYKNIVPKKQWLDKKAFSSLNQPHFTRKEFKNCQEDGRRMEDHCGEYVMD